MDRLPQIIRSMPRHCFEKDNMKAWSFLFRDLILLAVLGALVLVADTIFLKLILSALMGCVLTGIFVIGHDAGHRSFSDNKSVNDMVGHLCCSLTLWPYQVWRLSHDHHHKWTHHAENDVAWKPLTVDEFRKLSLGKKCGYYLSRTAFFFWASMLFQYFMIEDAVKGRFFARGDREAIRRSLFITAAVAACYAAVSFKVGGWQGLLFLFIVPQLVYQFWLSFFTLFHHTTPEAQFMSGETWDPARAQLAHSIHLKYPPIVDWLTHDIAWHVPHHVCVSIPHYRLRDAHASLKKSYPQIVTERKMTPSYLWNVISKCHLIDQAKTEPVQWVRINIRDHIIESDPVIAGEPG